MQLESESRSTFVVDLRQIEKLSHQKAEENQNFSTFLKTLDAKYTDEIVVQISRSVAAQIDCKKCGNCCRSLTVAPDYQDISSLALALDLEVHEFKRRYMKRDHEGDMVFKQRPCPMLKNGLCSVYESRPKTCRTYPHLEKNNFISRLGNVLSNLKVCPIAFNTFELLKLKFS